MAKMTKKAMQAEAMLRHGFRLQRIFPKTKDVMGPVELYDRLRRLDKEASRSAERQCNDENYTSEMASRKAASVLKRLDAILGFKELGIPVFVNGDPRGYSLKIEDTYVREHKLDIHTDWGGYGILAPEV